MSTVVFELIKLAECWPMLADVGRSLIDVGGVLADAGCVLADVGRAFSKGICGVHIFICDTILLLLCVDPNLI